MSRKFQNPFILAGYAGPAYFCDRQKETDWLEEQYKNERNIVLHSWRRMGKTSLILHFFNKKEKQGKTDCIFIDLLGTSTFPQAVKKIAEAVVYKYGSIQKGVSNIVAKLISGIGASLSFDPLTGLPQLDINYSGSSKPEYSLQVIAEFLVSQKKSVIVAIDEFQQVVNYDDRIAEATFRSWAHQFPSIRFIFSGSHRHMMMSMFSEENRPFFRSAQLLGLEPIQEQEYSRFIVARFKGAGKNIFQEQVKLIFDWTRNQTYYIQLACNKLYGMTDHVGDKQLQQIFNEMVQQEIPLFSSYQQLLTSLQWKVFVAIAKEGEVENPMSQAFLSKHNLGAASSVKSAIEVMVKKELLVYWEKRYQLHDTLLLRWLQRL